MDKGDILSILAALIIVSLVAVVLQFPAAEAGPEVPVTAPAKTTPEPPVTPPSVTPSVTPPEPPRPFRISYASEFWDYPCIHLPDNLMSYGGSDPLWKNSTEIVPFAYIEEGKGGITETFHVPYAVWRLNCSVSATIRPEAAYFRMALVDLKSGAIVKGAELRYPGSIIKNVQRGGKEFYLIVGLDEVDSYRITLETLTEYL